jgi:small-conductance mechanosensitive channel
VSGPNITDHTAVSVFVMYTIAVTIVVCNVIVILAKGVDAMPFDYLGIVGSVVFIAAAIGMAQYVKHQPEH